MKKVFLAILLAVSLALPAMAEVVVGASIVTSLNALSGEFQNKANRNIYTMSLFSGLSFADTAFWFSADWQEKAGINVKVNAPASLDNFATVTPYVMNGTYAWFKLGNIFRTELGLIEKRQVSGLNSVVDKFYYGVVSKEGGLKEVDDEIDLLRFSLLDFYLGPVTLEFVPVDAMDKQGFVHDWSKGAGLSNSTGLNMGLRLSGNINDMAKLVGIYKIGYKRKADTDQDSIRDNGPTTTFPETREYTHSYGLYAEINLEKVALDMVVGYGGRLTHKQNLWGNWGDLEMAETLSDIRHGIDFRLQYTGIPRLNISTHNKFAFTQNVDADFDRTGTTIKAQEANKSNMTFWNAVGVAYDFTDNLRFSAVVFNKWRQDDTSGKTGYKHHELSIEPTVRYNFTDNLYIQGGVMLLIDGTRLTTDPTDDLTYAFKPSIPLKLGFTF